MTRIEDPAQLLLAITRGHRPRSEWGLGLEYEQFVTDHQGRPLPYSGAGGVEELLRCLARRTGWQEEEEEGRLLALRAPDGRSVTLEPGAQIEFGSGICPTLGELDRQVKEYFGHLAALSSEFPVCFVALGSHPTAGPEEIERIPKARYGILEPHLAQAGDLGLWMMKATAGVQVNFDHEDAADAALKLRTAFALSPVLTALFANSPLRAGRHSGFAAWRGYVWSKTDPFRCGLVEACIREESTLQDYVDWALKAPMLFVVRDARLLDLRGRTFGEYLRRGRGGLHATLADWELHLSTLFPEVRFRPQLELRCLDTGPPGRTLAGCALVKGIFYDPQALQAAWELTASWSAAERLAAWHAAHFQGLSAPAPGGGLLLDLARELLGLVRLEREEAAFLSPLKALAAAGRSPGETLSIRLEEEWGGSVRQLVASSLCVPSGSPAVF
ncbi:MAG: glutamate--cysteine ligase [Planctomycetota bacterium]